MVPVGLVQTVLVANDAKVANFAMRSPDLCYAPVAFLLPLVQYRVGGKDADLDLARNGVVWESSFSYRYE